MSRFLVRSHDIGNMGFLTKADGWEDNEFESNMTLENFAKSMLAVGFRSPRKDRERWINAWVHRVDRQAELASDLQVPWRSSSPTPSRTPLQGLLQAVPAEHAESHLLLGGVQENQTAANEHGIDSEGGEEDGEVREWLSNALSDFYFWRKGGKMCPVCYYVYLRSVTKECPECAKVKPHP